jgi:deoxyribodipyrimidine photolyase-related protein
MGDQLNIGHSWFKDPPSQAEYLLMEVLEEATYAQHHIQKIIGFFVAMREFSQELMSRGFTVHYTTLDTPSNKQSFTQNIEERISSGRYSAFEYQQPDEYRVVEAMESLCERLPVPTRRFDTEHFLTTPEQFQAIFKDHKRYVMEIFYREVRRTTGFLMKGGKPIGDQWNFDAENRKKLPAGITPPPAIEFPRDVSSIVAMLTEANVKSIGTVDPTRFTWAVSRHDALEALEYFCEHLLPEFGSYQDAMTTEHRTLFHSKLSFALNVKLISPREVIEAAIDAWENSKGAISIEQIEGFVRQIAGWREFMRGVYWTHMPRYKTLNFFGADRPLPHYFWDADTKMNCVRHSVQQSLDESYAHHIQRLMVTGNFAVLAGINPDDVDAWYLGIYADAVEWVQLPNTRGMSQFADGGIVGTKPYTSSAQYINKMSNYCSKCFYNYKEKFGERGCPFNTLYWSFLSRNRDKLEKNPRIGMGYRLLDKMSPKDKAAIEKKSEEILSRIEEI